MTTTQRRTGDPAVYEAMRVVIDNGLRTDGSAFTPGTAIWTPAGFSALRRDFIDQPDLGKAPYLQKLQGQLAGATDPAIQLMAELHYLHLLLPSTTSGSKKREIIATILGFMQSPAAIPAPLAAASTTAWSTRAPST